MFTLQNVVSFIGALAMIAGVVGTVSLYCLPYLSAGTLEALGYLVGLGLTLHRYLFELSPYGSFWLAFPGVVSLPFLVRYSIGTRAVDRYDDDARERWEKLWLTLTTLYAGWMTTAWSSSLYGVFTVAGLFSLTGLIGGYGVGFYFAGFSERSSAFATWFLSFALMAGYILLHLTNFGRMDLLDNFRIGVTLYGAIVFGISSLILCANHYGISLSATIGQNLVTVIILGMMYYIGEQFPDQLIHIRNIAGTFLILLAMERWVEFPWGSYWPVALTVVGFVMWQWGVALVQFPVSTVANVWTGRV